MDNSNQIEDPTGGKLRYLRPFIVLVPTLIICIINIYMKIPEDDAMIRLLITIVVFFAIGTFVQYRLRDMIMDAAKKAEERAAQAKNTEEAEQKDDEAEEEEAETEE